MRVLGGADAGTHGFRQGHAVAFDDDVDVVAGTAEETVAHVAADDEGPHARFAGDVGHDAEDRAVEGSFDDGHFFWLLCCKCNHFSRIFA